MEDSTTRITFDWYLDNPFLPVEAKEAIFCSRKPMISQWKATLQREQERQTVNYWPVTFTLQYFPPDPEEEVELEVTVSVEFIAVGNDLPSLVPVVFNKNNCYTYTYNSSIRPEHGELKVVLEIEIPDKYTKTEPNAITCLESMEALGNDLKRLRSDRLYFDLWLQTKDPGTRFPAHSWILDARWFHFFRGLAIQPNPNDPPTVETDISPDVLDGILTYLYTGSVKHFDLENPSFQDYRTDMFQAMDKYPMHHLYILLKNNLNAHIRRTKTHISSTAMTFRLGWPIKTLEEDGKFGPHVWTHSPLPGVSVTTSLKFTLDKICIPSLSYTLRFTNAMKLFARVCVEYRRRVVGLDREMRRNLFESDHEIPCNGIEVHVPDTQMLEAVDSPLYHFKNGLDRREGSFEVEHSLRFIVYLSKGDKCIRIFGLSDHFDEQLSFNIFRKHMSNIRRRKIGANLRATAANLRATAANLQGTTSSRKTVSYRLHKAIFAARIPNWRNVIEEVPVDDGKIPNRVTCILSNTALPYVIDFLYTGTCSPPSETLHRQISHFATQGGSSSLGGMPGIVMPADERDGNKRRRLT